MSSHRHFGLHRREREERQSVEAREGQVVAGLIAALLLVGIVANLAGAFEMARRPGEFLSSEARP